MAVGFPAKTNFATGDVLTAANVNDITGTLNLLNPPAKGNISTASAANTPSNLTVGSNGSVLTADSSTSSGLRYTSDRAGAKNGLINSAFDVSQRGATITGISADNTYTADRWYVTRGGTIDYALKNVAGGNNPPVSFDSYAQYINQTAANPFMSLAQTLETKDSIRFADSGAATLSFYARATANTSKSKSIKAAIGYNTTADTKMNTFVGSTTFTTSFGTAATDWTFCTLTVGIPSTAKTVGAYFLQDPSGGLAVGDGFEITGVQLERQAVATAFQRNSGTIQAELAACQRYYFRNTVASPTGVFNTVFNSAFSTTHSYLIIQPPVTLRTGTTAVDFSALRLNDGVLSYPITALTLGLSPSSSSAILLDATVASGLTQYRPYFLQANADANAYIAFSAEL
jgi:hypothetical protein